MIGDEREGKGSIEVSGGDAKWRCEGRCLCWLMSSRAGLSAGSVQGCVVPE